MHTTIDEVARFLLTKPPLDELTDELAAIAEKYRYKMWSKKQSIDALIELHEEKLQKILDTNLELASI